MTGCISDACEPLSKQGVRLYLGWIYDVILQNEVIPGWHGGNRNYNQMA